jgi:hypothetical protein
MVESCPYPRGEGKCIRGKESRSGHVPSLLKRPVLSGIAIRVSRPNTREVCPFNNERFVPITSERDYRADWRDAEDRPDVPGDVPRR